MVTPHSDSHYMNGKQTLWIDQRWEPTDISSDKDSNRSEAKLLAGSHNNHSTAYLSCGLDGNNLIPSSEHGSSNGGTADYAEVDPQSLTTFYNNSTSSSMNHKQGGAFIPLIQQQQQSGSDLAPYATTTLIQQQRRPQYVSCRILSSFPSLYTPYTRYCVFFSLYIKGFSFA